MAYVRTRSREEARRGQGIVPDTTYRHANVKLPGYCRLRCRKVRSALVRCSQDCSKSKTRATPAEAVKSTIGMTARGSHGVGANSREAVAQKHTREASTPRSASVDIICRSQLPVRKMNDGQAGVGRLPASPQGQKDSESGAESGANMAAKNWEASPPGCCGLRLRRRSEELT